MAGYDDVIVGGGSAGIALAVRLSEDPARRVLLIEAGPAAEPVTDDDVLSDAMRFSSGLTQWGTEATYAPGITYNYPQGRKLGGGSAVNGAFAVRGLRDDYERWASFGGPNWSWEHMLRVLCRLETDLDFPGGVHGDAGPVPIVRWRKDELLPGQQAFLEAVTGHGIPWVDDVNAPDASGIGVIPMNRRDGIRMSTGLTYLPLARGRENLTVWTDAEVGRIVLSGTRAVAVELVRDGTVEQVEGARITLSAGALQSPTLLQRSGIGPAKVLADAGVPCVVDLPGVGENLMEHTGAAVFLVPRGELPPPDDRICQLGARWSSSAGSAADDMWLSMWSAWELAEFPELYAAMQVPSISAVITGVHDPASRGIVRLRDADPSVRPEVDFRMLSEPVDLERIVEGLQLALELASSPAFAEVYRGIGVLDPSMRDDRDALEATVRASVGGWYHASGTCRLGADPDDGAVVDGSLAVHGVEALHVADASIMPTIVRSPTNLSSIAIGERAAELLRDPR